MEITTIEVAKHDVYEDGSINKAVIRHEKYRFADAKNASNFLGSVINCLGFIKFKRTVRYV